MEVDSAPQPSLPPPTSQSPSQHHQLLSQHQSPYSPKLPPVASKPTLPPPTTTATQSPREPPLHAPPLPHSRPPSGSGVKDDRLPPVQSPRHVVPLTNGVHQPNGQYYAPPQQPQPQAHSDSVIMDQVSRLQTQTSYNTAGLETHNRRLDQQKEDIARLEAMVGRMQQDMRALHETVESFRAELRRRPAAAGVGPASVPAGPGDDTLEMFATNLTSLAAKVQEIGGKVQEVDNVKLQCGMMKRRVARIEQSMGTSHDEEAYSYPREGSVHAASSMAAAPAAALPKLTTPIRPEMRSVSGPAYTQAHHSPATESTHTLEQDPPAAAWASVNSGSKRGYPSSVDARADTPGYAPGSPKRPKLAPMEPQVNMDARSQVSYERMDTDESYARTHSRESFAETTGTATAPATASTTPTSYVQYQPQTAGHEDNWRQESQRSIEQRSPKRGRGGGRVGRPRKSMPADFEVTPEWEKPEWAAGSQPGPDGYYQPVTPGGAKRGGSLVRRGSGGGGNASARAMTVEHDLARQSHDPYAHTKKTRTKPTRNADGILIRKDGRPDMRSHSSAANLRKVHARKEQERALEHVVSTPNGSTIISSNMIDTPSPRENGNSTEASANIRDRHDAVMKQVFPHGVDNSKERMDYVSRLFPAVNSPSYPTQIKAEAHSPQEGTATPDIERERENGAPASETSEEQTQEKSPSAAPVAAGNQAAVDQN